MLAREHFTPVPSAAMKKAFPAGSKIPLASGEPTLVLFVHPLCPCTRASFHELKEVLGETHDQVSTVIVFSVPHGLPANWKDGDLWRSAKAMREARVVVDQDGVEAGRFGVKGSGHCLLYSPTGDLLFSGGITGSRGHEGENPGSLAVRSLIATGRADITSTPVFGCSLL